MLGLEKSYWTNSVTEKKYMILQGLKINVGWIRYKARVASFIQYIIFIYN